MMAELEPEYLIPSHTKPVLGKDNVKKVLQDRIRGITFVYDAVIAAINNGLNVEEAIASITFPKDLAELPQFKESYGTLVWSIRGIYQRETGWYDGRGSGLNPLPEKVKAQEIVQLAGGVDKILSRAIELQKAGDHQLACELCDIVIAANTDEKLARIIKSFSLDYMSLSSNGNMMGFYRSAASLERKKAGYKIE
jgi:alkyl sulfatase BDS1-like metallo-beta-lactamase superfamily hydrolase